MTDSHMEQEESIQVFIDNQLQFQLPMIQYFMEKLNILRESFSSK